SPPCGGTPADSVPCGSAHHSPRAGVKEILPAPAEQPLAPQPGYQVQPGRDGATMQPANPPDTSSGQQTCPGSQSARVWQTRPRWFPPCAQLIEHDEPKVGATSMQHSCPTGQSSGPSHASVCIPWTHGGGLQVALAPSQQTFPAGVSQCIAPQDSPRAKPRS